MEKQIKCKQCGHIFNIDQYKIINDSNFCCGFEREDVHTYKRCPNCKIGDEFTKDLKYKVKYKRQYTITLCPRGIIEKILNNIKNDPSIVLSSIESILTKGFSLNLTHIRTINCIEECAFSIIEHIEISLEDIAYTNIPDIESYAVYGNLVKALDSKILIEWTYH